MDADAHDTWTALERLRWTDLRASRVLLLIRAFGAAKLLRRTWLQTFGPVGVVVRDPDRSIAVVMIGRPWTPIPASKRVRSIDEVRRFAQPGWLKYGLDFTLTPLADDRTLLETRTLCEPTDATARRRFAAYWRVIGLGSALIRHELLDAVARAAELPQPVLRAGRR